MYNCVVCDKHLFSSEDKYEDDTGWATFNKAAGKVHEMKDLIKQRLDMHADRIWCRCYNCGAHLGFKFRDGPEKYNNVRYTINSASLNFITKTEFDRISQLKDPSKINKFLKLFN